MEYKSVGPGWTWRCFYWIHIFMVLCCILTQTQTTHGVMNNPRHQNKTVAYACEGSTMYISCSKGEVIRIIRANYGRFTLTICNMRGVTDGWDLQCTASVSSTRVKERCDGRQQCRILVSNNLFGEPCMDTVKYLEAHYYCEKTVTPAPPTTTTTTTTTPPPPVTKFPVVTKKPTTKKPRPTRPSPLTFSTKRPPKPDVRTTPQVTLRPEPSIRIRYCLPEEREGVWWPSISAGYKAERPCPNGRTGMMSWRCGANGRWIGTPDLSRCVSQWVNNLEDLIDKEEDINEAATEIVKLTRTVKLWPGDLKKTTESLLPKLRDIAKSKLEKSSFSKWRKKEEMEKLSQAIVETGSNLLSEKQATSWKTLPPKERSKVATSLMVGMEETGFEIAATLDAHQSVTSMDDNILLEVNAVSVSDDNHGAIHFPSDNAGKAWHNSKDRITISKDNLYRTAENGVAKVVFLVYNNLKNWTNPDDPETPTESPDTVRLTNEGLKPSGKNDEVPKAFINSKVISASITNSKEKQKLEKPVSFVMHHIDQVPEHYAPDCVFWEFNTSKIGYWSSEGCVVVETNSSHTTCQCNHLTNFAILMDMSGTKLKPEHEISLRAITIVGCTVSIICLACSFFTFCFFKNLQCDRNTIHKNLVFTLMLAELIFVVAIEFTWNKIVCAVVAGLLHFLFLAAFAWMCLEGVQLYVMLIEVFDPGRSRRLFYYLAGYGIPAIIVAVSAGVMHEGYGTDTHCWLTTENGFIWSFIGPVAAVITVNIVMLSVAVYMMCKHANTLASNLRSKEKSRLQKISQDHSSASSGNSMLKDSQNRMKSEVPAWLKGAAVLVFLLGLTWAFGVMYVNKESLVMAYVFTVCNSLQGLFIFIFHCLLNEKVKKEYKKLAYRSTWLPSCFRDLCIGYSSTSHSRDSSSSGGHLLKFWSGRRRRKSSNSTITTPPKGHKRRSDPDSYSSRDNNTTFTHGGSNRQNGGYGRHVHRKSNGHNGHISSHNREVDYGIVGDLSVADCSVIDSEYVSEYCNNNLQVSRERRYSSGSEDTNNILGDELTEKERHRLSALSSDSALKHGSDFASSVDIDSVEPFYDEIQERNCYTRDLPPDYGQCAPLLAPQSETEQNLLNSLLSHYQEEPVNPRQLCPNSGSPYRPRHTGGSVSDSSMNHSTPNAKHIHTDSCNNNSIGMTDNLDLDSTQDPLLSHHHGNTHRGLSYNSKGQVDTLPNYTYSADLPTRDHSHW